MNIKQNSHCVVKISCLCKISEKYVHLKAITVAFQFSEKIRKRDLLKKKKEKRKYSCMIKVDGMRFTSCQQPTEKQWNTLVSYCNFKIFRFVKLSVAIDHEAFGFV